MQEFGDEPKRALNIQQRILIEIVLETSNYQHIYFVLTKLESMT